MEVAGINWTSEQAPTSFFKEKESRQTSLLKTKYILHVLGILFRKKTNQKKPNSTMLPSGHTFHHRNMPFAGERGLSIKHKIKRCAAHS